MKYKDIIRECMEEYSLNSNVIFLGYNVAKGNKADGSLKNVSPDQLFETPVAENLMMGISIGLSIEGYIPVVYYERFNFILNAMDAIVNHLDKFKIISRGEYEPKVIIRAVLGGTTKPFYTGITHNQDLTEGIEKMVSFPVIKLEQTFSEQDIRKVYKSALNSKSSTLIIEEKNLYDIEL